MNQFDVVVVGGGPAGMMAAGRAAECGHRVVLLEKNPRVGEKLNLTGGGRCNITNAEYDTRAFLAFFGATGKFLFSPFSRFAVQETFDFFTERGLPLTVEDRKRAFPQTHCATDVTRVLLEYLQEHGVEIRYSTAVKHVLLEEGKITGVQTHQGVWSAEKYILATGGAAYKATGSTGDGLDWLRTLGHTVHTATPDIVPLRVQEPWVKDLSGTTLDAMRITFTSTTGKSIVRQGKILFTHFGLSGPLILNSAHEVKQLLKHGNVAGAIDLFPHLEPHQLNRRVLTLFDEHKNKTVRNVIKFLVPQGMSRALTALMPAPILDKKVHSVTQEERKSLSHQLKNLALTVTGTMGYDWAIISDGGVELNEIDMRTMRSRLHANLYLVGDLLHINRPSGGYSLQLCWTTGWVAGECL